MSLRTHRTVALACALVCFSLAAAEDLPRAAVIFLAAVGGALVALLAVEDLLLVRPAGLTTPRRSAVTTEGGA